MSDKQINVRLPRALYDLVVDTVTGDQTPPGVTLASFTRDALAAACQGVEDGTFHPSAAPAPGRKLRRADNDHD